MASENTGGITTKSRLEVMKSFQRKEGDVGSPEVQVALITQRIEQLTQHFAVHKEDVHSRRGMMRLISQRKQLLGYLKKNDVDRYRSTIAALGLRK